MISISDEDWEHGCERLIQVLEQVLGLGPKLSNKRMRWALAIAMGAAVVLSTVVFLKLRNPASPAPIAARNTVTAVENYDRSVAKGYNNAADALNNIANQIANSRKPSSPPSQSTAADQTGKAVVSTDIDHSELPSGEALLFDGNTHYDTSGFSLIKKANVPWGSGQADILFGGSRLFTQNSAGEAPGILENAPADANAHGGLQVSPSQSFGGSCPLEEYIAHWFPRGPSDPPLTQNTYFCLRLRDGTHYAKIKITHIEADRMAFKWIYQPSGSRSFK